MQCLNVFRIKVVKVIKNVPLRTDLYIILMYVYHGHRIEESMFQNVLTKSTGLSVLSQKYKMGYQIKKQLIVNQIG